MTNSSILRVAPGASGVSIWSSEIFGDAEASRVRDFLSRAFSVREVEGVELRRAASFGRIRYKTGNPAQIWKQLSRALSASPASAIASEPVSRVDAAQVFLDLPGAQPVRVTRIGGALSTWRVRYQSEGTLSLSHPALRNRRDVVFRLEEELAAILGVEDFRASALTAGVSIRFDKEALTPERLALELEQAWPRLLEGLDGPPSRTRLFAAAGLVALSFTGQYLVPALRPAAVAATALYSSPNVLKAVQEWKRGDVGIYTMYSAGLGFMLASGLPFTASVMATLMQLWPHLARRTFVRTQRRLFAGHRRRPTWARVPHATGVDVEAYAGNLRKGDLVVVRPGEVVPVDGVVENGLAAVSDEAILGSDRLEDKSRGDAISAGTLVRDGSLTIRVERTGAQTAASYVDTLLPRSAIDGLPSSEEAEYIANRNAKPALALSAVSLLATRTPRLSQVLIRPDYATGPRLSAQLSALQAIAYGFQRGVLFRNPSALDRLGSAEVFVIDDTAGLDQRGLEVATVQTADGASAELVVGYALAAHETIPLEQSLALASYAASQDIARAKADEPSRLAGVTRYTDSTGQTIEIATTRYLAATKIGVPARLARSKTDDLSLWVVRDKSVLGVVTFGRTGEYLGKQLLASLPERARVLYLSRHSDADARSLARAIGFEHARGGLSQAAKLDVIRSIGRRTVWIGDATAPDAREVIAASTVSVSVAPLSRAREDAADVLLSKRGLTDLSVAVEISRDHARRIARDYRTVYAANLLGVTGGVVARFSSLHAGLLSHFGTGMIYIRHSRELSRLVAKVDTWKKQRSRLRRIALSEPSTSS